MKKTCRLVILAMAISFTAFARFTETKATLYFASNSATLERNETQKLLELISQLKNSKVYAEIIIDGYTDKDGSNDFNLRLSEQRAKIITKVFVDNGISRELINENYFGERKPVSSNEVADGKSKNRRVEILLRQYEFSNTAELMSALNMDTVEIFIVDASQPIDIKAKHGTRFTMNANCFMTESGKEFDIKKVRLEVREIKTVQNAIANNLLTQSSEGVLQSGGMFKIDAYSSNEKLKLKKGCSYGVAIANSSLVQGMNVYNAGNVNNGLMQWQKTENVFKPVKQFKGELPSVKLDEKIIQSWKAKSVGDASKTDYKPNLPPRPMAPFYPIKPNKPVVFKPENWIYSIPWYRRIFMSHEREVAYVAKRHKYDLNNYEERLEYYNQSFEKYKIDTALFKSRYQAYLVQLGNYHELARKQYELYMQYKLTTYEPDMLYAFEQGKKKLMGLNASKKLYTDPAQIVYTEMRNYMTVKVNQQSNVERSAYRNSFNKLMMDENPELTLPQVNAQYEQSMNRLLDQYYEQNISATAPTAYFKEAMADKMEADVAKGIADPANYKYYYQSQLDEMGWINCDRFNDIPVSEMRKIQVPDFAMKDKNVYVVLNDIGSNMIMYPENGYYVARIPKGKSVTVLAVGINENNQPAVSKKTLSVEGNQVVEMSFKNVSLKQLMNEIKTL
ncbi:MAG: OmpA family protein [Bacteroidia bacterium]